MINFRELKDVDVESVVTLWKRCELTRNWNDSYKDIKFAREGETSTVLVGLIEGRVVASVMVGHDGHRGVLYYLAVDPAFQKRGFGKAAVAAAETWLRERGVWRINLMVRSKIEKAGRFY
jgi:ribosomal protein S18 acetylase RimI-like enzyme